MPRGTIRKTFLAGIVALAVAVLLAFVREYYAIGSEGKRRGGSVPESEQYGANPDGFRELESRRNVVAAQRSKRAGQSVGATRGGRMGVK